MKSIEFLDAVRDRHGLTSDRKLAALLGIEQPRVSAVRNGRRRLDPEMAVAVAKALELPPEHVFAAVAAERAKRTEHRRIWERLAKLAKTAHVLEIMAVVGMAAAVAHGPAGAAESAASVYYVVYKTQLASFETATLALTATAATVRPRDYYQLPP